MIGIYDSGVGGLGIFKEIRAILPKESIRYFAESAYFPFGDKDPEVIKNVTCQSLQKLAKNCSILVLACNTASVTDLEYYRNAVSVPVVGVVPVIKTAAQLTQTNHILLLATAATCKSTYVDELIAKFAKDKQVDKIACSGLADAVENNDDERQQKIVEEALVNKGDADVVILGSTHYTMIKGLIQNIAGPDIKIIDSNAAVARNTLRVMRSLQLERPQNTPEYIFESNDGQTEFKQKVDRII